jgi:hypothetical protein
MAQALRATRYLNDDNRELAEFIAEDLHFLDLEKTLDFYNMLRRKGAAREDLALLAANDRFFLLTGLLNRRDAIHPWIFDRCREVESDPDNYLDLWAREHYKSTLITFAGAFQEIIADPEVTIGLFSWAKHVAIKFVEQIQREAENNEKLKVTFPDVFWYDPKNESPKWSGMNGLIFKRSGNPKEATVEGHGLDNQPTSRHFKLRIYDDVVTRESCNTPEKIKKTTEGWELSDNLGSEDGRMWNIGTRYHFGDTWGILMERKVLKPRIYPATENGRLDGKPVFFTVAKWEEKKKRQPATIAAQMLQNPAAGAEATFSIKWMRPWEVRPGRINVYIMVDPSRGKKKGSDRTAISVVGVDALDNRYLLDGYRHRMNLAERIETLRTLHRKWTDMPGVQLVKVGYEQYGMQSDVEIIQEDMKRSGYYYPIEELNWPREGDHSKKGRVERLVPDFLQNRFYLPAVVWHETMGKCTWSVNEETLKLDFQPFKQPTSTMKKIADAGQPWRVAGAIMRKDEAGSVYDLTRALIEEMMFFPFAPKDDLVDCLARLYDMEPIAAQDFESIQALPEENFPDA